MDTMKEMHSGKWPLKTVQSSSAPGFIHRDTHTQAHTHRHTQMRTYTRTCMHAQISKKRTHRLTPMTKQSQNMTVVPESVSSTKHLIAEWLHSSAQAASQPWHSKHYNTQSSTHNQDSTWSNGLPRAWHNINPSSLFLFSPTYIHTYINKYIHT